MDLSGTGTVTRIVSFIGVGVLMLVIGYVAPLPADGAIWLALFDPAFQPPKQLLNRVQKRRISGQEEELELRIAKPLAWNPPSHVYMGERYPKFYRLCGGLRYQVQ